jgi:hypothetical protein
MEHYNKLVLENSKLQNQVLNQANQIAKLQCENELMRKRMEIKDQRKLFILNRS